MKKLVQIASLPNVQVGAHMWRKAQQVYCSRIRTHYLSKLSSLDVQTPPLNHLLVLYSHSLVAFDAGHVTPNDIIAIQFSVFPLSTG